MERTGFATLHWYIKRYKTKMVSNKDFFTGGGLEKGIWRLGTGGKRK